MLETNNQGNEGVMQHWQSTAQNFQSKPDASYYNSAACIKQHYLFLFFFVCVPCVLNNVFWNGKFGESVSTLGFSNRNMK